MQRTLASLLLLIPFVALAQGGDRVSAYVAGMAALEDSSYGEAVRWFERAVAEDPQFADAYFGMAMAYAPESPLHDERRISQSLERAIRLSPDNPRYLEAQLQAYRRTMPEARAYSTTDTRRPVLASRLLAVDPENALAHGELALNAFLEFDWRRQMARRQGGWDPHATGGTSGAANRARARAEEHMIAALRAEPGNISVHRLRLRLAVLAEDNEALERAATSFAVANPANPYAQLYLGLMAHRRGNVEQADLYFDKGIRSMDATERIEFERIVHLMGHGERAAFEADSSTAVSRFWRSRDPRLLSQENERQIEHYARLAMADLLFAEPQNDLRGWETPRGEVVVRYGMPDGHGRWLGADFTAKRFGALERWVYEGEDGFSLVF
ncbi:MAG: GWxTD domain-containing protein, partial [Rubricoccaceae bacterium]|nr:GWxTD domain-containing protein [Rubricoccaceae bacterium]